MLAALGLSAEADYDMNSLAVPRKAKEAIGAIARLTKVDGSGAMTVNVEYNQLDPLLRSTINKEGDVNDASGEWRATVAAPPTVKGSRVDGNNPPDSVLKSPGPGSGVKGAG